VITVADDRPPCPDCGYSLFCLCLSDQDRHKRHVEAAMHLGALLMERMGSPAGALGQVSFADPEVRAKYEALWKATHPKDRAPAKTAWERLEDDP